MNERSGFRDLPGDPVAKTPCSQCRGPGFNPCSGTWIPHAATKGLPASMKIEDPAATETLYSQINIDFFKKKKRSSFIGGHLPNTIFWTISPLLTGLWGYCPCVFISRIRTRYTLIYPRAPLSLLADGPCTSSPTASVMMATHLLTADGNISSLPLVFKVVAKLFPHHISSNLQNALCQWVPPWSSRDRWGAGGHREGAWPDGDNRADKGQN